MKVALLSYNACHGDGIGQQVAEKVQFFQERSAEIRVFLQSLDNIHPFVEPHVTLVVDSNLGSHWEFLQNCELCIVEFGHYYPLLDNLPLISLRNPKARILIDYHGVTPAELWGKHNEELLRLSNNKKGLIQFADEILVHSRFNRKELLKEIPSIASRIQQIGYPVNGDYTQKGESYLRKSLRLEDRFILLFVGRLAPHKQVPLLVDALNRLFPLFPEVHLVVVGDDGDLFQEQAKIAWHKALDFAISGRVHFLGKVSEERLKDAYRSADLFVTASEHEGFGLPVVEAMVHGVPVVAARRTALPETIGDGGFTFESGNFQNLADIITEIFPSKYNALREFPKDEDNDTPQENRVAVVLSRLSEICVSGADRSLQRVVSALVAKGFLVDVYSSDRGKPTCWKKQELEKIQIFRFPQEPGDQANLPAVLAEIQETTGAVPSEVQTAFLNSLPNTPELIEALDNRSHEYIAIFVGPYLSRQTFEVAGICPEKTILLPCFHDEPQARLEIWHQAYQRLGGYLYHSEQEKLLAEAEFGFNHPNSIVLGTWLAPPPNCRAKNLVNEKYLVYCGRMLEEKNVPLLVEYAKRYNACYPGRWKFVFAGEGDYPLPQESWLVSLGVVSEEEKNALLMNADAVVTLSVQESLSLLTLESWQQGTPVIAHRDCEVIASHLRDCGGGALVGDYPDFEAKLNDLWGNPNQWEEAGERGRNYVQEHYGNRDKFAGALQEAIKNLDAYLYPLLQKKCLARGKRFSRERWQETFGEVVENLLHQEKSEEGCVLEVRRRVAERTVPFGTTSILVPVRVRNWGSKPAPFEGQGRWMVRAEVRNRKGTSLVASHCSPLPCWVNPCETKPVNVSVPIPLKRGKYVVTFRAVPAEDLIVNPLAASREEPKGYTSTMRLTVEKRPALMDGCLTNILDLAQQELSEADRLQRLPDDYLDITQGKLASVKRKIKKKLLHNFKTAYIDVLSRQQSAFNRQIISVVKELVECCTLLDQTVRQLLEEKAADSIRDQVRELKSSDRFTGYQSDPSPISDTPDGPAP